MTSSWNIARQSDFDQRQVTEEDVEDALKYVQFLHGDADGWIPLFNKPLYGKTKAWCYRREGITPDILREKWAGRVNSYVGLNTMFIPRRKNKNTRQLRAIGLDIDYRHVDGLQHVDHDTIIYILEHDYFGKVIPRPNAIIHGNSIQLIILLEPAPFKQTRKLWRALVKHFIASLKALGADGNCKDFARVMRLPGTWHRDGMKITVDYLHEYRYSLRELQEEYLPLLPDDWKEQRKERLRKRRARAKKQVDKSRQNPKRHSTKSLNWQRMKDLETLCELREWNVTGHREQILFLYRYHALLYYEQPALALQQTRELNSKFVEPYESLDDTNAAEEMWKDKQDIARADERRKLANEKNGVEYKHVGYNYRNATVIEMLKITATEEAYLSTIISEVEKKRRQKRRAAGRREKDKQRRRTHGIIPRVEYESAAVLRREKIVAFKADGLSNRKIAKVVGCSESEIRRCLKQIDKHQSAHGSGPLYCGGGIALPTVRPCPLRESDPEMALRIVRWYSGTLTMQSVPSVDYDPTAAELVASKWDGALLYEIGATAPQWMPNSVLRYAAAWFHLHKVTLATETLVAVLVSAHCPPSDAFYNNVS